jgi:hypothetical protein
MSDTHRFGTTVLLTFAALAQAQDGARERAVARQIDAQVRGQATTQPGTRGEDAVAKLVRVLDEGSIPPGYSENSARPGTPFHASIQLRSLGPLAFDTIYRLLPELGAFGTTNALELLAGRPDERFARQLEQMLRGSDAAKQVAAAELMDKVAPEGRKPLSALARASANAQVRAHGVVAAAQCGVPAGELQAELETLLAAPDKYVLGALEPLMVTDAYRGEAGRKVLESLLRAKSDDAFRVLANRWLQAIRAETLPLAKGLVAASVENPRARGVLASAALCSGNGVLIPLLADLVLEVGNDESRADAVEALARRKVPVSPATLSQVLAAATDPLANRYAQYLNAAPLDASHGPVLEATALDASRPFVLRSAALNALDRVAPERLVARAEQILADDAAARVAQALLAPRLTPQLVPVAVRHILRIARVGGQWPGLNALFDAVADKSDASNLVSMLELLGPLPPGVQVSVSMPPSLPCVPCGAGCGTSRSPTSSEERWWQIVEHAHRDLREIVTRVATPADAGSLVGLYFAALRRVREEAVPPGGAQTLAAQTVNWLSGLLPKLAGVELTRALSAHLADQDAADRVAAMNMLINLPGTDRKAVARTALAEPWSKEIASTLAYAREVAQDEELRDGFVRGVLADAGGISGAPSWRAFLSALPADARRKIAGDVLAAHQKQRKAPHIVAEAARALGGRPQPRGRGPLPRAAARTATSRSARPPSSSSRGSPTAPRCRACSTR